MGDVLNHEVPAQGKLEYKEGRGANFTAGISWNIKQRLREDRNFGEKRTMGSCELVK